MDSHVNNIRQRLSLRTPLAKALELTSQLVSTLSLTKPPTDPDKLELFIAAELAKMKAIVPSVRKFDRDFPSLAFSIATGIGKTRLMGAIIAYLYLKKGIKHFFILAPNITLYEKLIRDFGDSTYEKYVFKGISEFVASPPNIVTGDTYTDRPGHMFSDVEINIFNISKFNKDSKEGSKGTPRMRRLPEYLGQSYFDYLASLPDLVVLMDEVLRYHADASKRAINELRPILGVEMTATPFDEKSKTFRNIVFEYNLAEALDDGLYVKNPAIAKARNFNKANFTPDEIEIIKLEDGIVCHERTKTAVELYARQNDRPVVKPFILVACKDIAHARAVKDLLESDRIFNGRYKGKVLQIDSSTKKDDDISRQFVALESPDNEIEIVVHVNMLKEGWDVNNLYTIIPLRAADAAVLIEQTIGRGLRLPYGGRRTGNKDVDTLTVIAHDNFQKVIEEAQKGNSILKRVSFIELEDRDERDDNATVETTPTTTEQKIQQRIEKVRDEIGQKADQYVKPVGKAVQEAISNITSAGVATFSDLQRKEVKAQIRQQAVASIKKRPAVEQILVKLMDKDDIDYDEIADLLYKLIEQGVAAVRANAGGISDDELNERVHPYRQILADNIYKQMKQHYRIVPGEYKVNKVLPFSTIHDQKIIVNNWGQLDYHDPVPEQKSLIKKFVYVGFNKSYYIKYRFDSSTELDFAVVLETSGEVLKWLRPAPNQFSIYWANGSKRYEPDFIVETADAIYMCETKAEKDVDDADVRSKACAAKEYCHSASEFTTRNGGKPWRYIIIPHTLVDRSYSFNYILLQTKLK